MTREPLAVKAAVLAAVAAVINAAVLFGLDLSAEQVTAVNTAVAAVATVVMVVWVRPDVTPVADPRIEGLGAYAPPVEDDAA